MDCHYRTATPSTGTPPTIGWFNTNQAVNCASCHGMGTSGAGLPMAHAQHVGNATGQKAYGCWYCHPSGVGNASYATSHQTGAINWNFANTLDPGGARTETYNGAATGTQAVRYVAAGTYYACANVYCHVQTPTPRVWSSSIGPSECLMCHQKGQLASTTNPASGLHYGSTAPTVSGKWHDDTAATGCPTCHTAMSAKATHVTGTFEAGLTQTTQMGLITDYKQTVDGVGTCYGTVLVSGTACHGGPGEVGRWALEWNSATHYATGDTPCTGCHGGLGANDWSFGTGARVAGHPHVATLAVDSGTGQLITLAEIDEHSVEQVVAWLKPWVVELGIEVLVSDDLAEYGQVAKQLGLQHQVCHFHLIRWVERALRELEGELHVKWHGMVERLRPLRSVSPE